MDTPHKIAVKILSGGRAGVIQEFESGAELLIGRDPDADIRLHPTEDRMVGRRHAKLFFRSGKWYLEALHDSGVMIRGELASTLVSVPDNEVYRLGPSGPELRIAVIGEAVPETVVDGVAHHLDGGRVPTLPRAEFDPAEVHASIQQASHRTQRRAAVATVILVLVAAGVTWLIVVHGPGRTLNATDIQRFHGKSVFRAASTVRFRCTHDDVAVSDWQRYWVSHGTAYAVARRDDWVYALTNYHVFGDAARPDLSVASARLQLVEERILERWPRDWPILAGKLKDFDARRAGAAGSGAQNRIGTQRYAYIDAVTSQCEFDLEDENWRQVVIGGSFVPVEVVDSSRTRDVVLFRFKSPAQAIEPLPLLGITTEDQDALAGEGVYILGFPGSGDLPFRRSRDAMTSEPAIAQGVLSDIKRDQVHGGYSIQVTAPINSGNSGGPLFDARGHVVGVNTWGPSKAEAEGISYALTLHDAMSMLRRHGLTWRE